MIHIFHGEDAVSLRNHIVSLKKSSDSFIELQSNEVSVLDVLGRYFSSDLFASKITVSLEVTKDKSFDFEEIVKQVSGTSSENDIIFWASFPLTKTHPLMKSKFSVREFKPVQKANIFNFLDALFEKRKKDAYRELQNLLNAGEEEVVILSMINTSLRNLSYAVFGSKALEKLHPFVKVKVLKQAKNFTEEDIKNLYEFFYNADLSFKTGLASVDVLLPLAIEKVTNI